ncbi:MAG: BON domain-containing protein [Desulfovibrionaceae bacterium]
MHRTSLIAGAVLLAIWALAGCNPFTTAYGVAVDERGLGDMTKDRRIKSQIIADFAANKSIEGLGFSVYSYYGKVFLVGEQEKPDQKALAVTLARRVSGVESVATYILDELPEGEEAPCPFTDRIQRQVEIEAELLQDMDATSSNVEVQLVQCDLVLLGVLESQEEIDRVADHARRIVGVRKVVNFLMTPKP